MVRRAVGANVSFFCCRVPALSPLRPMDGPELLLLLAAGAVRSSGPLPSEPQFCFLYLFMIQSASSMALLIICWILSGLSSSE